MRHDTINNATKMIDWVALLGKINDQFDDFSVSQQTATANCLAHENTLTKPAGSLGRL